MAPNLEKQLTNSIFANFKFMKFDAETKTRYTQIIKIFQNTSNIEHFRFLFFTEKS